MSKQEIIRCSINTIRFAYFTLSGSRSVILYGTVLLVRRFFPELGFSHQVSVVSGNLDRFIVLYSYESDLFYLF